MNLSMYHIIYIAIIPDNQFITFAYIPLHCTSHIITEQLIIHRFATLYIIWMVEQISCSVNNV